MKKKKIFTVSLFALSFALLLTFGLPMNQASASSSEIDFDKVRNTSQNVTLDGTLAVAKEYSIPILIVSVVISGFLALGGIMFKPLKLAASSLLGIGILFFILVNYAPQIAGVLISIVDGVVNRVSGGA